jgi:hypothetical protein
VLLVSLRIVGLRLSNNIQTVDIHYIYGLTHIKTLRKPAVVGIEEREDVFFGSLVSFKDLNAMLNELQGINHIRYAIQKLPLTSL